MFGHQHARKLLDRRVAILAFLAIVAVAFGASNADATLSAVGPTSQPTGGFPRYFTDSTGLRLELCLDQSGNCLAVFPDPASPPSLPDNFPDESFWWDGTADIPIPGPNGTTGSALLVMATEAAFANNVVDGDQIAFSRIRLRIINGIPNQDYTFTHPYGTLKVKTGSTGGVSSTSDVGCFTFPCDWSQVLRGAVGPFLKWDAAVAPAAPAGYIGNPAVLHKVTGSPTNTNFFRVNGGGNTLLPQPSGTSPGGVQTNLFAIQGKIDTGPEPPPPGPVAPAASFVPTSLSYAPRNIGTTSAAQTVTLTNTGTATMNISSVTLTGTNPTNYAITAKTCGLTLAANASCTVDVTFTPSASGTRNADLTFTDDATGSPHKVPLSGIGNGSAASLTPASMTFASQNTGTTSTAQTATMTNSGNVAMAISSIALTGVNSADYQIVTNGCGPSLAGGASCSVSVAFSPTATGTRTAALTFTDDAAGSPHSVALSGTGATAAPAPAPVASITPTSLVFPDTTTGTVSALKTVTVTNTGNAPLVIGTTPVTGPDFAVNTATSTCAGASVPAAASCTIDVRFVPASAGAKTGTLTINDNAAGNPHTVGLSGNGIAPAPAPGTPVASVTPASRTYADQLVGTTSAAQNATITNTGNAPLTLSVALAGTNPGDYVIASNSCAASLAALASCTVGVTFKPTATGARSAVLRFTDNSNNVAGSTQDVALSGAGIAPAISATPNPLVFGTSNVGGLFGLGATTVSKSVSVTNTGTAPLTITTSTIGAAASSSFPADYTITANGCANKTIAPPPNAVACSITIRFGARGTGTRNAVLSINNNAPGSPAKVSLTGTGA